MTSQPAFRIAFRHEGKWWNAYLAKPQTMSGATQVGSILWTVAQNDELREAFIALMKSVMETAMRDTGHDVPHSWDHHTAPPHEKSGNS